MEKTRKQAISDILRSLNPEQKSYFNVEYHSKKADLATAFRLPEAIRERNEDVAMQIIKDIKIMNFND